MSVGTACHLWQLRLKSGLVFGLSNHDDTLSIDDVDYLPQQSLQPSATEQRTGFATDSGTVRLQFDLPELSADALRAGALDDARLSQFSYDWLAQTPPVKLSEGRIGDVRIRGDGFEAEWLGLASLLERSTGRVFSRQCDASFGDARCGLNAADFADGTFCPRSFTACRDKFANAVNFRGFPYLLGDDALQAGVGDSDRRDGSSRYRL